jgi:hypothetical protein
VRISFGLLLSLSALWFGCADDFRPASLLDRARLVGIEVVIDGDPGRAAPLAGATFVARPIVLRSSDEQVLTSAWFACPLREARTGAPSCAGPVLSSGDAVVGMTPPMMVTVPADAASSGIQSILFAIATCDLGAVPAIDMESTSMLPACSGGDAEARAELSVMVVALARDEASANRHPSLDDETISLVAPDGTTATWAPPGAVRDDCALATGDPSLPHITVPPVMRDGEEVPEEERTWTLQITSTPDDRERYQVVLFGGEPPMETREVLQISHYVTEGTLARQFSAIEGLEDTADPSTIDWLAPDPADVPSTGRVAHFWWVARDLRGGMAWVQRTACLVP